MTDKIQIVDNKAEFTCPKCLTKILFTISQDSEDDTPVTVNRKCVCGYNYSIILDKRRFERTKVEFSGKYIRYIEGVEVSRRQITIIDVSLSGLRFIVNEDHNLHTNDIVEVVFHLDNEKEQLVHKKVMIRYVINCDVGAEFCSQVKPDGLLVRYLEQLGQ